MRKRFEVKHWLWVSECNVCGIISLIEFSKAIVLVVTVLGALAYTHTYTLIDAVKLLIYENIIKCVGKCWMRCECKYLDLYHLKLCVCIYDLREVSSGSGLIFLFASFHQFEHSGSSSSSCRSFTIILSCVHNYLRFCGRVALLPLYQWTMGRATQHASIHRMNEWMEFLRICDARECEQKARQQEFPISVLRRREIVHCTI